MYGATTGTTIDFSSVGVTSSLLTSYRPTSGQNLGQIEAAAVAQLNASTGVVCFTYGGNEYLIGHVGMTAEPGIPASPSVSPLGGTDTVVQLIGVQNHALTLSGGVAHLA